VGCKTTDTNVPRIPVERGICTDVVSTDAAVKIMGSFQLDR
jgi:hypothetical protein